MPLSGIYHRFTYIKIHNIHHRQKITAQTDETKKNLDVRKVVKQIKQNTYDRKNKNNTILERLKPNREKDIKKEPLHKIFYSGKNGTRSKERHKDQN